MAYPIFTILPVNMVGEPVICVSVFLYSGLTFVSFKIIKRKMNIMEGKVALVTGAASGLGFATAKAFAEAGAAVALADWNEKKVQAAAKKLAGEGHRTLAVTCDVSDDAQVEAMVKKTVEKL